MAALLNNIPLGIAIFFHIFIAVEMVRGEIKKYCHPGVEFSTEFELVTAQLSNQGGAGLNFFLNQQLAIGLSEVAAGDRINPAGI